MKRYTNKILCYSGYETDGTPIEAELSEHPDGEYVRYEDVNLLEDNYHWVKKELNNLATEHASLRKLLDEVVGGKDPKGFLLCELCSLAITPLGQRGIIICRLCGQEEGPAGNIPHTPDCLIARIKEARKDE